MRPMMIKHAFFRTRLLVAVMAAVASLAATAHAAAPGISGGSGTTPVFNLTAQPAYLNQPDGSSVYSWGYGCQSTWSPTFLPATIASPSSGCPLMQVPGPRSEERRVGKECRSRWSPYH